MATKRCLLLVNISNIIVVTLVAVMGFWWELRPQHSCSALYEKELDVLNKLTTKVMDGNYYSSAYPVPEGMWFKGILNTDQLNYDNFWSKLLNDDGTIHLEKAGYYYVLPKQTTNDAYVASEGSFRHFDYLISKIRTGPVLPEPEHAKQNKKYNSNANPVQEGMWLNLFWNTNQECYANSSLKHLRDDGTINVEKTGYYYVSLKLKTKIKTMNDTDVTSDGTSRHNDYLISKKWTGPVLLEHATSHCEMMVNASKSTSVLGFVFQLEEG